MRGYNAPYQIFVPKLNSHYRCIFQKESEQPMGQNYHECDEYFNPNARNNWKFRLDKYVNQEISDMNEVGRWENTAYTAD